MSEPIALEGNLGAENIAVFGIFVTPGGMEAAVEGLTIAGFSCQDVSIVLSDKGGLQDFTAERHANSTEAASTGAEVGGMVGGTLGLLLGLGALAIPGVGPLVAAGPLMASLAGLGVGGALGGLVGALVDLGIPEYEAKLYDGRLKDGAVLLSVRCVRVEQIARARDVLQAAGAEDIASSGEDGMDTQPVGARLNPLAGPQRLAFPAARQGHQSRFSTTNFIKPFPPKESMKKLAENRAWRDGTEPANMQPCRPSGLFSIDEHRHSAATPSSVTNFSASQSILQTAFLMISIVWRSGDDFSQAGE